MKNRGANWVGWTLHFVFGVVLGVLATAFMAMRLLRDFEHSMDVQFVMSFLAGGALLGGAICSFYGDRVFSNYDTVLPSDPMTHSDMSRICSLVTGLVGAALLAFAVFTLTT